MRALPVAFSVALAISLVPTGVAQTNDCAPLLDGGAFNTSDTASDATLNTRMIEWYCNQSANSSSTSASGSATGKAGTAYEAAYGQSNQSAASACASSDRAKYTRNIDSAKVREASRILVDGYNQCLARNYAGAYIAWKPGADPADFFLVYGLRTVAGFAKAASATITSTASGVSCSIPSGKFVLKAGVEQVIPCRRTNLSPVNMSLNSNVHVTNAIITIPGLPKPLDCNRPQVTLGPGVEVQITSSPCVQTLTITAQGRFNFGRVRGYESANIVLRREGEADQVIFSVTATGDNGQTNYAGGPATYVLPANSPPATVRIANISSQQSDPVQPRGVLVQTTFSLPQ